MDPGNSTDKAQKHYAEGKKADTNEDMSCVSISLKLKNRETLVLGTEIRHREVGINCRGT